MIEDELIDYLAKYNGFTKDYKNLFPLKEETINLLFKVTLPDGLDSSFYSLEKKYIKNLNSRFVYLNPKDLSYVNSLAAVKESPTKIKGDILVNPLFTPIYNPQELMKKELNDELISYGGLEIRRDLLREIAKNNHEPQINEMFLLPAYYLPYRKILHMNIKKEINSKEDINLLSAGYISLFKTLRKEKARYVVIPSPSNDHTYIEMLVKTFKIFLKDEERMKIIIASKDDEEINTYNSFINGER